MEQYNPLDYESLGDAIASAFLHQPLEPITSFQRRDGSGVYGLYYFGSDAAYGLLSSGVDSDLPIPIYVGSSIPKSRSGLSVDDEALIVAARLANHLASLKKVGLADQIKVRYLTVNPAWAVLAEAHLIKMFQPVWNVVITGLGNNPPGAGRSNQRLSRWDIMHPGRRPGVPIAPAEEIRSQAAEHLRRYFNEVYPKLKTRLRLAFIRIKEGPGATTELPPEPPAAR
jgi:hypothetical protein